ncbi:MAG TPA: PLP-dependent transferase [Candidatus Dormibacteraeota bacterium]|nr:PLP-dependent transferase [Candidatus Dormibacteraeota bacterium]
MNPGEDIDLAAIRAGALRAAGSAGADLVAPPSLSSVRSYPDLDALDAAIEGDPRAYRRYGSESVGLLEATLATLETPPGGATPTARVTASGQAALLLLVSAAVMSGRRRVVLVRPSYGGTEALLLGPLAALGVTTTVVDLPPDTAAADAGELVAGVAGTDVALVVVEVVTNPLIAVVDVPAVAAAAHRCGAVCLVDSTFATPFLFQPLAHGADLVMHSLTKHLGGHSDVLGGVALAADGSEAAGWLDSTSRALGAVLAPFDAWLTQRGLRTAPLRVERGSATAASLAVALDGHPALAAVHHPAVRGAGEGSLARRLLPRGTGPMLSLEVRGGRPAAGRVVRAMGGIRLAPSLGDVGTTVSHPATTSHRHLSPEARQALGISDGLLRFSVGIEDETVLRAELEAGLDAAR